MARSRSVAVITGASAGVGRATARAFAKDGAWIGLLARGRDGLEEARREIEDVGSRALVLPADVSNAEEVEAAAVRVEQELGSIDVWVNCAMVSVLSPVREMKADEFQRVMEVNYLGYVHGTLAALRVMLPRNRGVIVQVSSALAFRSIPLQSAYCASKRAIVGFTESLRSELIHDGSKVHVTMVHLPAVNTPQFEWVRTRLPMEPRPLPPVYQPEVAARAIVWAASHRRRDVTVGFSTAKAINANKLFPGLLDRLLARKAYREQQTDAPVDRNRPDNLYAPVPEDHGAHGRFDQQARRRSVQLWITTHRRWLAAAGLFVAVAGALGMRGRLA